MKSRHFRGLNRQEPIEDGDSFVDDDQAKRSCSNRGMLNQVMPCPGYPEEPSDCNPINVTKNIRPETEDCSNGKTMPSQALIL